MRIQTLLLFALLSPAGAVLAQSPATRPGHAATRSLNPVGTYDVSFVSHGEPGTGMIIIAGTGGNLKGTLEAHGHSIPLTVSVDGRTVALRDSTDISITMSFAEGGAVTGKWSGHGESGSLTVTRRRQ
jgi:hypothetical protein